MSPVDFLAPLQIQMKVCHAMVVLYNQWCLLYLSVTMVSETLKVATGMFPSITNTNEGKCIVCEGDSLCTQSNF